MTDQLTQYFENFAESSIQRMKDAVLAINYYERVRLRLTRKEDLSGELPDIAKLGPKATMEVVKEALADYKNNLASAWTLPPRLLELGKSKCSYVVNEREHLPRVDLTYQFKSSAGAVKIHITTAGETFRLEIDAGKNPMGAQLARREFEKNLTFIALTS